MRVIDNASQTCDSNETSLNWDQKGVKAYGRLTYSSGTGTFSIDTNRSYNISNLHEATVPPFSRNLCFTVPGNPKNITVNLDDQAYASPSKVAVKDQNGWTSTDGAVCDQINSSTNVYVQARTVPFFVTIH